MLLTIDVGNTYIKIAVFEQDILLIKEILEYKNWKNNLKKSLKNFKNLNNVIISSVGKLEKEDFLRFFKLYNVYYVDENTKFPFKNLYKTPLTLGTDRKILASGAVLKYPNKNRLVIDAGTCITYDFIDIQNNYNGGAISPGIRLRYESLNNYTQKLPLLKKELPNSIIGNSTNESIHSGIINGVTFEIDEFINEYSKKYENFIIILTGGDSDFLAKRLKNTIFANSNFLLESLNKTFQFNNND